ncbi:MAG: DNA-3-methyladenine glycosylase family protein, partial [Geminicoccaceae bacterium]
LEGPHGRAFAFPSPEDLAERAPDELRALGFSRQKALAIIELARALAERRLDLDQLEQQGDEAAVERLRALRGVGRWTAEYVLLRGLGRLHVFPGDDIGARNNLQRWLGLLEPLDYDGVQRTLARWAPYQGLVYLHLLLKGLQLERERPAGSKPRMRPLAPRMLR